MARAIGDLVEVKKMFSDNEWEWAIITGPQVAHSSGKMMYRIWNIPGYRKEYIDRIRDFTGSDDEREEYLGHWEQEKLFVKGGSRKRSRRYRRNKRGARKTRR